MPEYIYVLGMDGKPQMPTTRKRHVQKLLNTGKARIAGHVPYTIQLLYNNNPVTQPLCLGIDPGRTNIGVSVTNVNGDYLFSAVVETRNREISKLMADRAAHRRASRRGERKARQRLAKRHGTMIAAGYRMRKLPQYGDDKFITCKGIKNTQARFCNRKRKEGWLTPTANQLLQTHLSVVKKVQRYLPVTDIALEINRFAFMQMDNPETSGIDFQNGLLKGYDDVETAIDFMQDGKCLMCRNNIEHYHHLVPKSKGGSNTITNIAGLCKCCHEKAHIDATFAGKLNKTKTGQLKKYGALSVLNQIIPYLYRELQTQFGETHTHPVSAKDTARMRNSLGFVKTTDNPMHEVDAYCISILASGAKVDIMPKFMEPFHIKQFRCHDRAVINNQRERTYKLDGVVVAKNRMPRFEQKGIPALSQWFKEQVEVLGRTEAERLRSRLKVERSVRRYNTFPRVLPGAVYLHRGNRYVLGGQQNNGYYYYPYGDRNNRMPAKECIALGSGGLVFI